MHRLAAFVALGALAVGAWLLACNAVLGINQASLEPTLDAGASGGGGDGGLPDAASLYALDCNNYCQLMATYCQASAAGNNLEYQVSQAGICQLMCPEFEVSGEMITAAHEPQDTNTLNCRVWHANAARLGEPHTHCPHAGPLGGTVCDNAGDPCEPFCRMDVDFCTGDAAAYASYSDCLAACRPDPEAGSPGFAYRVNVVDPEISDLAVQFQSGSDTLNCRLYHLENYLRTRDPTHCTHTSRSGGGVCTSIDGG